MTATAFHGYAHGAELPAGADAAAYSAGFVIASGMLHLSGIGLGLAARWPAGRVAVRLAGAAIAAAGVMFLRVAGSWIAAIAALVLALRFAG